MNWRGPWEFEALGTKWKYGWGDVVFVIVTCLLIVVAVIPR